MSDSKPNINVTPLIDVLLVLLIIFMVIAPSKPNRLEAKVPQEPQKQTENLPSNPNALIVIVNKDGTLTLNAEPNLGTVADSSKLIARLGEVFQTRLQNGIFSENSAERTDLSSAEKVEKTVFVKAPRNFSYGDIAKVVDAVKQTGANPVGLQIDALE